MAPAKRPWFRFYVEAVHDRKLRRLKPETRWLFVACLAAARQSPTPGYLLVAHTDPMGWEDLMDVAGMSRKQVEAGMGALADSGVVAFDRKLETWFIPNWKDRQYESDDITSRTRKHRSNKPEGTTLERSIGVPGNNVGTHQKTETDTDTSTTPPTTSPCPPEPGGGDDRLTEAATVLAQREADRRGSEIGNPAGYVRSRTKPIRDEHEPVWRRLLEAHPTMTVSQLVASLEAPSQVTPLDGTLRAALTLADRERRRRCGEACADCDDVGMVELDDGRFTDCRCKLPVAT